MLKKKAQQCANTFWALEGNILDTRKLFSLIKSCDGDDGNMGNH